MDNTDSIAERLCKLCESLSRDELGFLGKQKRVQFKHLCEVKYLGEWNAQCLQSSDSGGVYTFPDGSQLQVGNPSEESFPFFCYAL